MLWREIFDFMLKNFSRPGHEFELALAGFYQKQGVKDPKAARATVRARAGLGAIRMAEHIEATILQGSAAKSEMEA